jgi:hypothetical protein
MKKRKKVMPDTFGLGIWSSSNILDWYDRSQQNQRVM